MNGGILRCVRGQIAFGTDFEPIVTSDLYFSTRTDYVAFRVLVSLFIRGKMVSMCLLQFDWIVKTVYITYCVRSFIYATRLSRVLKSSLWMTGFCVGSMMCV